MFLSRVFKKEIGGQMSDKSFNGLMTQLFDDSVGFEFIFIANKTNHSGGEGIRISIYRKSVNYPKETHLELTKSDIESLKKIFQKSAALKISQEMCLSLDIPENAKCATKFSELISEVFENI